MVQYATARMKVRTAVLNGSALVYQHDDEKYLMEGAPAETVTLKGGQSDPGIPEPVGAFRFGASGPVVVVLWVPGYEGNSFFLLQLDTAKGTLTDGPSMYFCAF